MIRHLLLLVSLSVTSPVAVAQQNPLTKESSGTCRCCNLGRIYAPYLKDLPAPKVRNNIGNSHLKITTSSEAAQRWFDQGLNLLHAFWEFEAYRCFLQAAKEDPQCAMAYWGICMALPGKQAESAAERKRALNQAKQLAADPAIRLTDQEKRYIDMIDSLIQSGSKATIPHLRRTVQQYPEDANAIAFLGLWLRDGYNNLGKANSGTAEAIQLLQQALKTHPKHTGLNHYYIHVLEQGPDFEQARQAALALPEAAPGAGHLIHMPGHIYYLAGEYEKACDAFRACHQIESSYLNSENIPAVDNNNYLHNLHFLAYAAADQGRYQEALKTAAILADIKVPEGRGRAIGAHQIHYLSPTVTALVHMRAGNYQLAAASLLPDAVPNNAAAQHYIRFLRSYCWIRSAIANPVDDNSLKIIQREKLAISRHFRALKDTKPSSSAELQPWAQACTTCKILLSETRAWTDNMPSNKKLKKTWAGVAIRDSQRASYTEPPLLITPVEESLGWLALHAGDPAQARTYFQQALKQRRQSGHAYLGMARSYRRESNPEQASLFYRQFLKAFALADKNLTQLEEARNYLKQHTAQPATP